MEKKINNILFITGKDGSQLALTVFCTHYSLRVNKDYAVFYNEADENHLLLFSFDETYNLSEVNNPEEISELEEVLHKFDEENAN